VVSVCLRRREELRRLAQLYGTFSETMMNQKVAYVRSEDAWYYYLHLPAQPPPPAPKETIDGNPHVPHQNTPTHLAHVGPELLFVDRIVRDLLVGMAFCCVV